MRRELPPVLGNQNAQRGGDDHILFPLLYKLHPASATACFNIRPLKVRTLSRLLLYLLQAATRLRGGTGHVHTMAKAQDLDHHAQMFLGMLLQALTVTKNFKVQLCLVLACLSHLFLGED